jgi:serine/threonine-protein phosphatase 2A regulatory subunit B
MREFDPLKSMEVGEDIVDIHWLQAQGKYQKLITSNSRSMKIWKMFERTNKKVVKPSGKELNLPKLQATETNYSAELQRSFPSKHLSPINSTSISSN